MGMEPFLIASSLNVSVGQRILRKLCPNCKQSYQAPPEVAENVKRVLGNLITPDKPITLYKGTGCTQCGNSGYQGRGGIYEVLPMSAGIMKLILSRASDDQIEKIAVEEGMITLKQDGYLKAIEGVTTMEEVLRVAED